MAIIIMMMMLMKMRAMMMRPCGAVQLLDVEAEAGVEIGEDDGIDGNNAPVDQGMISNDLV